MALSFLSGFLRDSGAGSSRVCYDTAMDVQTIFYTLGSIFMMLGILVLLALLIVAIFIQRKVSHLHKTVVRKIDELDRMTLKPARKVTDVVRTVLGR